MLSGILGDQNNTQPRFIRLNAPDFTFRNRLLVIADPLTVIGIEIALFGIQHKDV